MHAGLAHDWDRSDSLAVILFEIKPSGDLGECIFDVFVHVCSPFIEQCFINCSKLTILRLPLCWLK